MCSVATFSMVQEKGYFFKQMKETVVGNAELLQSVKTGIEEPEPDIQRQIKNSEIDGKNNLIVYSRGGTNEAAVLNFSVDKATLSNVAVGEYVRVGKVYGMVEFIDNGDDDKFVKNNPISLKVDESKKLFGLNGKSTEFYRH